jgi:hypothetical protein
MNVYNSTGTWPIQQSLTEQKQKSGLFTCSAEFLRPVGNTDLPAVIQTSIGPVDVWPEPTVSVGTDGFERINATGYGVWDSSLVEEVRSFTPGIIELTAQSFILKADPDNPTQAADPLERSDEQTYTRKIYVVLETSFIRKIGDAIPATPALRILDYNNTDITNKIYNVYFDLSGELQYFDYDQGVTESSILRRTIISHVKVNTYGTIKEIETSFELVLDVINFGTWSRLIAT